MHQPLTRHAKAPDAKQSQSEIQTKQDRLVFWNKMWIPVRYCGLFSDGINGRVTAEVRNKNRPCTISFIHTRTDYSILNHYIVATVNPLNQQVGWIISRALSHTRTQTRRTSCIERKCVLFLTPVAPQLHYINHQRWRARSFLLPELAMFVCVCVCIYAKVCEGQTKHVAIIIRPHGSCSITFKAQKWLLFSVALCNISRTGFPSV